MAARGAACPERQLFGNGRTGRGGDQRVDGNLSAALQLSLPRRSRHKLSLSCGAAGNITPEGLRAGTGQAVETEGAFGIADMN